MSKEATSALPLHLGEIRNTRKLMEGRNQKANSANELPPQPHAPAKSPNADTMDPAIPQITNNASRYGL
jgi:hypothetical protein